MGLCPSLQVTLLQIAMMSQGKMYSNAYTFKFYKLTVVIEIIT